MKPLWMDIGPLGSLISTPDPFQEWHDHGQGLLCTILQDAGIAVDIASTRNCADWGEVAMHLPNRQLLLMNVRSYNLDVAKTTARLFKSFNPDGVCCVGGMHATVAADDLVAEPAFDHICQGGGEKVIVDLVKDHTKFARLFKAESAASLAEWPMIDRRLWPRPGSRFERQNCWPLEGTVGWGPVPVASLITNRVCPWQCSFCNEASYIPHMARRPVDMVIDELNMLDEKYGPLGSVVLHDSMWFQNPSYLEEWLEKYPKRANRMWPYWAAGRADTVRKWPDLFEALVRQTNWNFVSIGFESGAAGPLKTLNKECTVEDNWFCIDLLNKIGDDFVREGKKPPLFWANLIWAIPGETREDTFETCRMISFMKYKWISGPAFYAPYPGSILGHQIIAEGKSLMGTSHDRFPDSPKMKGIDYQFYQDIVRGKYVAEINSKPWAPLRGPIVHKDHTPHSVYLFGLKNGKKRIAYGESPEDAYAVLAERLTPEEMAEIKKDDYVKTGQRGFRTHLPMLG